MSDRTLKLKVTLDSTQVGTEAKKSAAAIDQTAAQADKLVAALDKVTASAQRSFRAVSNLATVPNLEGAAPVGALPRAIDSAPGASRIRLRATREEVEKLGEASATAGIKVGNLRHLLAGSGLGALGSQFVAIYRVVVGIGGAIAGASTAMLALGAGATAGAAAIGYAGYQYYQLKKLQRETAQSALENNTDNLGSITKRLDSAVESGALRGDVAKELQARLLEIKADSERGAKYKSVEQRGAAASGVSESIGILLRDMQKELQGSFEVEESAARKHAEALARIQNDNLEIQEDQLKSKLERGLINQEEYYRKLADLQGQETYSHKTVLDAEEKQLREKLKRETENVEETARIQARLREITDEKAVLDADLKVRQEKDRIAAQTPTGSAFRPQPVNTDDLAQIGLFVGGGGQSSLMQAQLDELKRITQGLQRVETATKQS